MRLLQALPLLATGATALPSAEWRTQSIYQVVTDRFGLTNGSTTAGCNYGEYCGGTFQGLIKQLDYIQNMGFTAIWISPVVTNLDQDTKYGRPYHGYWAQDIYSINSHFGTAADLKALSAALHGREMYLMVDVVTNHMGYKGSPDSINYTVFNPFNKSSYYHLPYCALDYDNATSILDCWSGDTTVSLPDLKTEDSTIAGMWNNWIADLVANYSIDGLRIDSAQQVNKVFYPDFFTAAGTYGVGEVLNGAPDYLCDYQNYMPGMLNYASYFWIKRAFDSANTMTELANNQGWLSSTCNDVTLMPNFIENHDQARWPSFMNETSQIENAIAFVLMGDGPPIIYYGQEQSFSGAADPYNREPMWQSGYDTTTALYKFITKLNTIRQLAISKDTTYASTTSKQVYVDSHTLVYAKAGTGSHVISLFNNDGAGAASRNVTLPSSKTSFPANTGFTDILSCTLYTTDSNGDLIVSIKNGQPMVIFHTNGLTGSGLCSETSSSSSSRSSSTTIAKVVSTSSFLIPTTTTPTSTKAASTATTSTSKSTTVSTVSSTSASSSSSTKGSSTTSTSTSSSLSLKTSSKASSPSTSSSSTSKVSSTTSTTSSTTYVQTSTKSASSTAQTSSDVRSSTSISSSSGQSTSSSTTKSSSSSAPQSSPATSSSTKTSSSSSSSSMTSTGESSILSSSSTIKSTSQTSFTAAEATTVTCPTSNQTIATASNGKKFLIECGIDHSAGDMSMVYVSALNLTQCIESCAANSSCLDVSLSGAACYLKKTVGKNVYNAVWGAKYCQPATTAIVTFGVTQTTVWGTSVYLVGSSEELGAWDTDDALLMKAGSYPLWQLNVTLPVDDDIEYKFVTIDEYGIIDWESGDNRELTVPEVTICENSTSAAVVGGDWQD